MTRKWIEEHPSTWDADKLRVIGAAPAGVFDRRYARLAKGDLLPGFWWRVEEDGRTVGYGWMDVVWGDAEILLAVDPAARGRGHGSFILQQLEKEARTRGLNYVYNVVRVTHPEREQVSRWLTKRRFESSEDGSLFRAMAAESGGGASS
jgi:ribosomal protein S18 acetylase RimI-like enzyme